MEGRVTKPPAYVTDEKFGDAYEEKLHSFRVALYGHGSRVAMDGQELLGVRDVKVHQPLEGPPIVTIEFLAEDVQGFKE